jgi:uncharacterized membrane protein YfcA
MSFVLVSKWLIGWTVTLIITPRLLSALNSCLTEQLILSNHVVLIGQHGTSHSLRKIGRLRYELVLWLIICSLPSLSRVILATILNRHICHLGHEVSRLAFAWIAVPLTLLELLRLSDDVVELHVSDAASILLQQLQVRVSLNVFGRLWVLISVNNVLGSWIQGHHFY